MRRSAFFLAMAAVIGRVFGQTRSSGDQARLAAAASAPLSLIGLQSGRYVPVQLGAGLTVTVTGGVATIAAAPGPPPLPTITVEQRATPLVQASGKWDGLKTTRSLIYRNGMLQRAGLDFNIEGLSVVPTPTWPWNPDDVVTGVDQVVSVG